MVKKLCKYVDSKYQALVELILQVTLFGIEGFTMTQLVKITNYSEQSIQAMIKKINHEDNIIKIDQQHKPYKYSINPVSYTHLDVYKRQPPFYVLFWMRYVY